MKNRDGDVAIRLSGVSKRYTIHHEKPTLVERLANGKDEEFWALERRGHLEHTHCVQKHISLQ